MDKVTTNPISFWFNVMTSNSAKVKRRWYQTEPENKFLLNKREPRFGEEVVSFTRNIYFIIKIPPPSNHASCITSDYARSQNVTGKCSEMSKNGFYPSVVILLLTNFCGPFHPSDLHPVLIPHQSKRLQLCKVPKVSY